MKQTLLTAILVASAAMLLASCNRDDVITPDESEAPAAGFRPVTPTSSPRAKVIEWTPAPGQFINEPDGGDMTWDASTTPAQARDWAQKRLDDRLFVSLGSFGGYIVVGFDHSIRRSDAPDGYDFWIVGNSFKGPSGYSNEPGIVWVMQDTNGNGAPDDTWYELAGSDTSLATTFPGYSVTYRRPAADNSPVEWFDNMGNSGELPYMAMFHKQPCYYPSWVKADEYTLSGTRLPFRGYKEGITWITPPFGHGYADNLGSDNISGEFGSNTNRFRIADAINPDGSPANLEFIDFVKVQSAVIGKAGPLGEISTEVAGFYDPALLSENK